MFRSCSLVVFSLLLAPQPGPAQASVEWGLSPGQFILAHVDLLPMADSGRQADRDVRVVDGVITDIAAGGSMAVETGDRVIDGRGKTLLPGLIDMHVHAKWTEPDQHVVLYLAHGVTAVQSMHGNEDILALRRRIAAGEVLGPRFFTTGPTTATERIDTPEKARSMVQSQLAAGYDAIKMYGDGRDSMTRETYSALIRAAHVAGLRVVGHAPRNLPFEVVLQNGQDSIDHMEEIVYTSKPLLKIIGPLVRFQFGAGNKAAAQRALDRIDSDELDAAVAAVADQVARAGVSITPTLIAFSTIHAHTTDRFAELSDNPQLRYASPMTRRLWAPERNRYRRGWAARRSIMDALLGCELLVQKKLVAAFHRAGVPILTGTDAPLTFVYPGWSMHREIELLVECGTSVEDALRAATVLPARELGIEKQCGTIEVGKQADLLLVRGDPTESLASLGNVEGVFSRGRWLDRDGLDAALRRLEQDQEKVAEHLELFEQAMAGGDVTAIFTAYEAFANPPRHFRAWVEEQLNDLGYRELAGGRTASAIGVFEAVVDAFPRSSNAWDSLGEALRKDGDKEGAIAAYERSVELDPVNEGGRRALAELRGK